MTASLAASSPVLRRPLLSFAVRSDFLLKPRISARSTSTVQYRVVLDGAMVGATAHRTEGCAASSAHSRGRCGPRDHADADRADRDATISSRRAGGVERHFLGRAEPSQMEVPVHRPMLRRARRDALARHALPAVPRRQHRRRTAVAAHVHIMRRVVAHGTGARAC